MARAKSQYGFTLIELMIVVAIISILAAIALPAYQDYVARSQVSEGLGLATGAKLAIATHYGEYGRFPNDNADAGMAPPASISGRYISSVTLGNADGVISVAFASTASAKLAGETLTLHVTDNDGSLSWQCGGVNPKYLPSSCR